MSALEWVKKIYIYLFSAIGLVMVIIGLVQLINLGLRTWIFTKADMIYDYPAPVVYQKDQELQQPDKKLVEEYQKNSLASQRQRQAANAVAIIIVGAPLFLYHWKLARKEM
jgi:hypothetical protein